MFTPDGVSDVCVFVLAGAYLVKTEYMDKGKLDKDRAHDLSAMARERSKIVGE